MYSSFDCGEVGKGAVSDGLVTTDCDRRCGWVKCYAQVALVIAHQVEVTRFGVHGPVPKSLRHSFAPHVAFRMYSAAKTP